MLISDQRTHCHYIQLHHFYASFCSHKYITNISREFVHYNFGQLSLPSLLGRKIENQSVWLGLRRGVFTCVDGR